MVTLLRAWLHGALLGLGVAVPIGPINIEIIRRHLARGLAAGMLLGLGACSVDTLYILVISLGFITAAPGPRVQAWLSLPSAAILLLLAGLILRSARRSSRQAAAAVAAADAPERWWRHYLVGLALTASSPLNLFFWLGAMASGLVTGEHPAALVVGVVCGTVGWVVALNLALVGGRRLLRPGLLLAANLCGAMILIGFAGWTLWKFAAVLRSAGTT